jgi:hypothetical protein
MELGAILKNLEIIRLFEARFINKSPCRWLETVL